MEHSTSRNQRIIIWVITITLAVGTLGAYFLIIINNNGNSQQAAQQATDQPSAAGQTVDPTAYKVTGKVTELQTTDETVGAGEPAKAHDKVRVHYKGTIAQTGVLFDSSYARGEPAAFSLDQVIPGWSQGVVGMMVGGKRRIIIPSDLGYGAQGSQGIPPNSDLVFEVELLAINPAQ